MAKGIFTHKANSQYNDQPETHYQFPSRYYKRAIEFEGDWVAYYAPRSDPERVERMGYFAIAKVQKIIPDPAAESMYLAIIEPGTYIDLLRFQPLHDPMGTFLETDLAKADGKLNSGLMQWAIRPISDNDFYRIVSRGFPEEENILPRLGNIELAQSSSFRETADEFEHDFHRDRVETTVSRAVRDVTFRARVLEAYDSRCALTGLKFINGGGRAEVEAAHIRPVASGGPDTVRNGLALSGTIHWMFDRGLISLSENYEILISHSVNNKDEVARLLHDDRVARVPNSIHLRPHVEYLAWHRDNCFKV